LIFVNGGRYFQSRGILGASVFYQLLIIKSLTNGQRD